MSKAGSAPEFLAALDGSALKLRLPYEGGDVLWRSFGDGPPLVLLHGGHGSWMHWARNIAELAGDHQVLVPDMPSFGESSDLPEPATLEHLVQALADSLEEVPGLDGPIDLVGFSFGGLVAAHLAATPGLVHRLALLGTAGHGTPRRQTLEMKNWRTASPGVEQTAAFANNLRALMLYNETSVDPLALLIQELSCKATRFHSRQFSRPASVAATLARYPGPLLLMWGDQDVTAFPETLAHSLAEPRANCEWCLIPRAGHWVQFEKPFETNHILRGWFARDVIQDSAPAPLQAQPQHL